MPTDLSSIIFASSAVSLLTLGALLLRRRLPETLRIPSWFLGAREDSAERKLRFTLPPWLAWLCVLLFTLGACLLFWPTPPDVSEGRTRQSALVWVDPTLSAHLSRAQNGFEVRALALRLREGGQRLYGLGTRPAPEHPLSFRYSIVALEDQAAVETFLREESKLLVPYARPFAEGALLDALRENAAVQGEGGFFFAVSDGQAETLQSVSFLSRSFSAGRLFSTGAPRAFAGKKTEIIPASLARAWNIPAVGTPFQPLLVTNSDSSGALIPPQARPGIAIERFAAEDGRGSGIEELTVELTVELTMDLAQASGTIRKEFFLSS